MFGGWLETLHSVGVPHWRRSQLARLRGKQGAVPWGHEEACHGFHILPHRSVVSSLGPYVSHRRFAGF